MILIPQQHATGMRGVSKHYYLILLAIWDSCMLVFPLNPMSFSKIKNFHMQNQDIGIKSKGHDTLTPLTIINKNN